MQKDRKGIERETKIGPEIRKREKKRNRDIE
jgi:hypothetical protein